MTDGELVERARQGEQCAFDELMQRHQPLALGLAVRIVGERACAQELCQEALLHAYLSLGQLRQPDRFRGWLCGIVVNLCKNHLRRRPPPSLSLDSLSGGRSFDSLAFAAAEPGPDEIAEAQEMCQLIVRAIAELSLANQRAVFLYYFEQMSVREVAALLQISVPAVKGRLHKSRRQLRAYLQPILSGSESARPGHPTGFHAQKQRRKEMISVTVADVAVPNPESEHRVVVLLDEAGRRILPIWIGAYEASAIAMHLTPMEMPRPMTYNFMATLLEEAGVEIDSVTVSALVDDTFYATVRGTRGGSSFEVDARPSDAIALALRTDSPVFVTEEVIAASGAEIPPHVGTDAVARAKGAEDVLGEFRQRQAEEQQQREESRAGKTPEERRQQARVDLLAYVFGTDS